MTEETASYDVVVIGGGASGSALLYVLAKYSNVSRIALLEKYPKLGSVNSNAKNNSQTLHVGDIETNYSISKVKEVKPASMMVARYADSLAADERTRITKKVQKMILAVGEQEVKELRGRFSDLKPIFPDLKLLESKEIARVEPAVMYGRDPNVPVLALATTEGLSVDFGKLSESLVTHAKQASGKIVDVFLEREVQKIVKKAGKDKNSYILKTKTGDIHAKVVVVDTDSYSLLFAKSLGYGKEFSLIPIAGSFYFTEEVLKGKVYTMQEPKLPFAAVHGDPDLTHAGTRFGPTARFLPVLEARNYATFAGYFRGSGLLMPKTWWSFAKILLDPVRLKFLAKNVLYEVPYFGKYFFLPQVQKIIPNMQGSDLHRAKAYGGMRLQRVNTDTKELLLGEGKIIGDNIIFNMTPSPGASVCLYNAMRDAEEIHKFLGNAFVFDKAGIQKDLGCESVSGAGTSQQETYVS